MEGLAQLAFYPGVDTAFQARVTRFNNAGGLNGRKIKFLGVQETGTDPAKALSDVQSEVLKDHVFAVAPSPARWCSPRRPTSWCRTNPIFRVGHRAELVQQRLGFRGQRMPNPQQRRIPCLETPLAHVIAKPPASVRMAIINQDNPSATASEAVEGNGFKKAGFDVVYNQAPLPVGGATDYTPYVQALLAPSPT